MKISISDKLKKLVPDFKVGIIQYYDITVDESPKMLAGRLQLFQESLMLEAETKPISKIEPIQEWRSLFKKVGTDPSRYRPSSEALLRRVYKGSQLGSIHSAVDTNNFFSLQYQIPLGVYDQSHVVGDVKIDIGSDDDVYEGINGRDVNMGGKILTRDDKGAFGSPIVDSKRTMVTEKTKQALHIVYFQPSLSQEHATEMLLAIKKMFIQIHGGTAEVDIIK
ncbi:B3/4 domain-containing protein [Bacillus sp. Marseille-Q3570]|uniref:B3/B4 domain-containing protein n=1 Tax=Bacillus sp. Marseille-Q3570 TaxID=2963522 RepID=UPI0021B839BA|nr:phenylalanine--tRNA ligase beta subunit-related protein [Bacillus sp. Marseille-Q3570]